MGVLQGWPLDSDLEVTGPVVMKLYAATSARDPDWVARLADVHADGRSINITEGILRARFRDDLWGPPSRVEPGRIYEYAIDMQVTSNVFRKGHRLRLHLTSSSFPMWSRNQNTGNEPATDTDLRAADQRIYRDRLRPSHLVLPVIGG